MKSALAAVLALALTAAAPAPPRIDGTRLVQDLKVLSADDMAGRYPGTPGSAKARAYVEQRFREVGLTTKEQPFTYTTKAGAEVPGVNVWGVVKGKKTPDRYIVVTAHYDHLGVKDGQIFNGADDNASGTAALFAMAKYFKAHRPDHSLVFVALDAEEGGARGAHAFVAGPPVPKDAIVLNVNLDMVARGDKGELYASGGYHNPGLVPVLERVAKTAPVTLKLGHDRPEQGQDDWTGQSDHMAFHEAGIPFVYFGVEDHPDYHRPTDDFEKVNPDWYVRSVQTITEAVMALDADDAAIRAAKAN
ncbi:M20/M25/M40 family metallo-hydrolase [Caulobacter sp. 17J80-11]|uniref:M20/M25/M40 family metallo-hydrolase n=1 Tax=Caulobacter sp. 17J80-11 TaxID=2763502 RepID=UPI001653ECD2|nr:M20/M25/M40 family metallo-hydrolase [Caulobacter sp. 17J80-11]MBC6982093.1 M28 family peptidase [Caulobacter sp. 17J80-11]